MLSYIDRLPIEIVEYIHHINREYYANIIIKRWKNYIEKLLNAYNLLDYLQDNTDSLRDRYAYI